MQTSSITDEALLASIIQRQRLQPHIHHNQPTQRNSSPAVRLEPLSDQRHRNRHDPFWNHTGQTSGLVNELQQQYGGSVHDHNYKHQRHLDPGPRMIDKILTQRHQEYSHKQHTNAEQIKELIAKRDALDAEKQKLHNIKPDVVAQPSASFTISGRSSSNAPPWDDDTRFIPSRPLQSPHAVHGVDSFIRHTNNTLPAEIARYNRLRDDILTDYSRLYKPYDGHLGPHSYQQSQMHNYHMVRSIVDEIVENFLDSYFRKLPPALNKETAEAVLAAESREWEQRRKAIVEATSMQLIMEEIVLQGTKQMCEDVVEEYLDMYNYIHNKTNMAVIKCAEVIALDSDEGRKTIDPVYDLVTNTFYNNQQERNKHKSQIFTHSQHLHLQGAKQQKNQQKESEW